MKRALVLGVAVAGVVGGFAACGGNTGPAGPQGPTGASGQTGMNGENGEAGAPGSFDGAIASSISGVTPDRAFLARTADVSISGYGTNWSKSTKVDFGKDITVNKVTVASPTALVVNITTAKTATMGVRDVKVTDGSTTDTFAGAFSVMSPIAVSSMQGTVAQGSSVLVNLQVVDTSIPLDTTMTAGSLFSAPTPADLNLTSAVGITAQAITASDYSAQFQLFIDVPTTPGMLDLDLVSGPAGGTTVDFPLPKSLNLQARTATALTSGTAATDNSAKPYDSALYSLTPSSASTTILDFSLSTTSSTASPALILLPSDGKWNDSLNAVQFQGAPATFSWLSTATSPFYAIVFDPTGATGDFTTTATTVAAAATGTATSGDGTMATAITASAMPFVLNGGNLANSTSGDWVKITATAMSTLHVQTIGNINVDPMITVYQSDGTTSVGTFDSGQQADAMFSITTAGTYYVAFGQGQIYTSTYAAYQAIIRDN
jgi:hypothetical protein